MPSMASEDLIRRGRKRVRVALTLYDVATRNYRGVDGQAARTLVANKDEQARLWRAIRGVIEGEAWRDARPPSPGGGMAHSAGNLPSPG